MNLYYYPNRPTLIAPDKAYIDNIEAAGTHIAEQKFNGDNIQFDTDTLTFWNRQAKRHRYQPDPATKEELMALPKGATFNAELMNYKTVTVKNLIIIHACVSWNGKILLGKTWGDSRKICEDLNLPPTVFGQTSYDKHVLLSRTTPTGFWDLFQLAVRLDNDNFEGIVLKNPAGKLVYSTRPLPDVSWMLKVRRPCKKYNF